MGVPGFIVGIRSYVSYVGVIVSVGIGGTSAVFALMAILISNDYLSKQ